MDDSLSCSERRPALVFARVAAILLIVSQAGAFESASYKFSAPAVGGVLGVCPIDSDVPMVLEIETEPYESATSVVEKLADIINASEEPLGVLRLENSSDFAEALGNVLKLKMNMIGFTFGSETGLGIPRAPLYLSADWDEEAEEIRLVWENSEEYDEINAYGPVWGLNAFPGNTSTCTFPTSILDSDEFGDHVKRFGHFLCRLVASRGSLPSGVADVEVRPNSMAEKYRAPFSGGVAPNWRGWHDPNLHAPVLRHETRWQRTSAFGVHEVLQPDDAPYYQVIESAGNSVDGGIYRKFLGLIPGHRYRVNLRLNGIHEPASGGAVLTVNAHSAPSTAGSFTELQLCGKLSLPPVPEDARFTQDVALSPQRPGRWVTLSETNAEPDAHVIKIPVNCDTLHVWLRLQCNDIPATVGMDWVELTEMD